MSSTLRHAQLSELPQLAELLCFDLYAASRAVTAAYRPLLADLGLTYPQYLVLTVLSRDRTRTVKQLADALRLDYGTLTPLLRRMEAHGFVTRRRGSKDERLVSITLTRSGDALFASTRHVHAAIRDAFGLDEHQTATLQSLLHSVTTSATSHRSRLDTMGGC